MSDKRSAEEIVIALSAVEQTMLADFLKVPPRLAVELGCIRDCLRELLKVRTEEP